MQHPFLRMGLGLLLLASSGCELVADFDRSKIPGTQVDSGMSTPDEDAGTSDAATGDDAGGE
jgi:hypothetical protein